MTELKGTVLASGIVPGTTEDKFPTHYAEYGKGGFRTVNNKTERDNIPEERREEGMLVYVTNDDSKVHTYQYINGKWEKASLNSSGIPIYNQSKRKELGDSAEDDYIFIPSEEDLEGEIVNNTYTTQGNGSYLDIMFSAIRQLQTEVAKMRNAFRYGMVSYTGTETAMSTTINDIEEPEDEPLWALDPDMLSIIAGAEVTIDGTTVPSNLKPAGSISLRENKIIISDAGCSWEDLDDIVSSVEDNKIFLYITSGALKNSEGQYITMPEGHTNGRDIQIILKDITPEDEDEDTTNPVSLADSGNNTTTPAPDNTTPNTDLIIDINALSSNIPQQDKYNILVVISRNQPEKGGKNYVWVSIGDTKDSKLEGYYDKVSNSLKPSLIELPKYTFKEINLKSLDLYQLDFYSKGYDFSNSIEDVLPSAPSDEDYKYKVAHLTIRSVDNMEMMESIKLQLLNNELIFKEDDNTLWIKINNNLVSIAGSGSGSGDGGNNDNTNMNIDEIIRELMRLGIIYQDGEAGEWNEDYSELTPGTGNLKISSISDITFIHQATGKKFNFEVTSEGELKSTEIAIDSLVKRLNILDNTGNYKVTTPGVNGFRGFVSKLHCGEDSIIALPTEDVINVGLNSDRVKIGSFYMPLKGDTIFGCSHAYIELENSSDKDFPLDGCSLYFYHPDQNGVQILNKLDLKGILHAGSTYLIRGKKYSDSKTNPSTFIDIDDFDIEWYVGNSLIDFTVDNTIDESTKLGIYSYGFALVYDVKDEMKVTTIRDTTTNKDNYAVTRLCYSNQSSTTKKNAPYLFPWYYIDSIPINNNFYYNDGVAVGPWGENSIMIRSNTITKCVFELDPAQQALQSLSKYDSSRYRLNKINDYEQPCDIQYLDLSKATISFPNSPEEYPISKYTPRSSKYKKNIITDKTQFDLEKPNAVSCSFGINASTTRCFNWVSGGEFDEFVWIKNDSNTWDKYESYKIGDHELPQDNENFPRKRIFNEIITNNIYSRIVNIFPGCDIQYTSHKCIIDIVENPVDYKKIYTYIVGRADKSGNNPDINHCSEEYTFTLYPENYIPKIYLTTDQQGFHWIEYQVWSAAAIYLNNQINEDCEGKNVIPVLMNSGDMTQNGTRVNEWLDYFNGAKPLLKHLEHMAVVGNNDLCGPDPTELGTGDDVGKSNPYFFHVFTCYEINDTITIDESGSLGNILPISRNNIYIPSIYYFDINDNRYLMCNSEITISTCNSLYNLLNSDRVFNIYTGWEVKVNSSSSDNSAIKHISQVDPSNPFNTIYSILWRILKNSQLTKKKTIAVCHEMPFTVITKKCIGNNYKGDSRSISDGGALVGSHMNQISPDDEKSLYWFSRLCEYFNVRLVLGGHKHTYTCTYPVRENYTYTVGADTKNSKDDGPMIMPESLINDSANFDTENEVNLSKFPIISETNIKSQEVKDKIKNFEDATSFLPCTLVGEDNYHGVVYFMCQATGYKQTSNKELPSNNQVFSLLIPKTNNSGSSDKPDGAQRYPMYLVIDINNNNYELRLVRLTNIQTDDKVENANYVFTQKYHYKGDEGVKKQTAVFLNNQEGYCNWCDDTGKIVDKEDISDSDIVSSYTVSVPMATFTE